MAIAEPDTVRAKIELPFADPVGDPLRPLVARRFPFRTLLTPFDGELPEETVLYAVGRDEMGRVVVEVERGGEVTCAALLMGFVSHAPEVFAAIDGGILRSLPS